MKRIWNDIVRQFKKRITGLGAGFAVTADHVQVLLSVAAITVFAFLGVDIFYKIVNLQFAGQTAAGKTPPVYARAQVSQTPSAELYQIIAKRNLFLTTLKPVVDKNAGAALLPTEEYTAFDLKGTIAVDQNTGYAIVEEKGKDKQKLYRIGEMIGSARLIRITRNTAVLKSGEKEYVMKIKETAENALAGRSAQTGRSISISKQEVAQSLGDLKSIMSQAVVRPFFNAGVQQGFMISNIVPGSLYQRLGLQNGDVVTDVNNRNLKSADDLLQLVNVMQAGGAITVNLTRNGKQETIDYTFR